VYEFWIRGMSSDADVQTLRRLFRSVVSEGLPIDVSNLSSLGVEEHSLDGQRNFGAGSVGVKLCYWQSFRCCLRICTVHMFHILFIV
jgi:hypothetical protein